MSTEYFVCARVIAIFLTADNNARDTRTPCRGTI